VGSKIYPYQESFLDFREEVENTNASLLSPSLKDEVKFIIKDNKSQIISMSSTRVLPSSLNILEPLLHFFVPLASFLKELEGVGTN
jgi:hypothetical protein